MASGQHIEHGAAPVPPRAASLPSSFPPHQGDSDASVPAPPRLAVEGVLAEPDQTLTDMPLPAAAVLLDQPDRLLPAMLLDLARRGLLTLTHDHRDGRLGVEAVVRPSPSGSRSAETGSLEQKMLQGLTDHATVADFWHARSRLRADALDAARQQAMAHGWLREVTGRSRLLLGAAALSLVGAAAAPVAAAGLPALLGVGGGVGVALGCGAAARQRMARTASGTRRAETLQNTLRREQERLETACAEQPVAAARRLRRVLPGLLLADTVTRPWLAAVCDCLRTAKESTSPAAFAGPTDAPVGDAVASLRIAQILLDLVPTADVDLGPATANAAQRARAAGRTVPPRGRR